MAQDHPGKIGQLNGKWSVLFRIALASYPLILGWAVWVTTEIFEFKAEQAILKAEQRTFVTTDSLADIQRDIIKNALSTELRAEITLSREKLEKLDNRTTRIETLLERKP